MNAIPKLILFDGIPGSGKTTFAQKLCFHLQQSGYPARWHHEHDINHPVIPPGVGAYGTPDHLRKRITAWRNFASSVGSGGETVILESSLFQLQANGFVRAKAFPSIGSFYKELFSSLGQLHPVLVHFRHEAIGTHLKSIRAVRGKDTFSGLIIGISQSDFGRHSSASGHKLLANYFTIIQDIAGNLSERFPGKVIPVNVIDGCWDNSFDQICDALSLPRWRSAKLPISTARKLAGVYKRESSFEQVMIDYSESTKSMTIRGDGRLTLVDLESLHFFVNNRQDELRFELSASRPVCLRVGSWCMQGTGQYIRAVPDRFSSDRIFFKVSG